MTTQPATPTPTDLPEALRLADVLEAEGSLNYHHKAAAELRRLHALSAAAPAAPQAEQPGERGQVIRDLYAAAQRTEPSDTLLAITNAIQHLQAEHPSHTTRNMDSTAGVPAQVGAESYPPMPEPVAFTMGLAKYAHSSNIFAAHEFTPDTEHADEWEPLVTLDQAVAFADATAALRAREAVPSGWKLVPVERSYDQRAKALIAFNTTEAKKGCDRDDALQAAWEVMLAAAPAAPGSGVEQDAAQYRLLQADIDSIEATDEFLSDDTLTWAPDPNGIFVGMPYAPRVLRPARRLVAEASNGLPALTLAASKGQEGGA